MVHVGTKHSNTYFRVRTLVKCFILLYSIFTIWLNWLIVVFFLWYSYEDSFGSVHTDFALDQVFFYQYLNSLCNQCWRDKVQTMHICKSNPQYKKSKELLYSFSDHSWIVILCWDWQERKTFRNENKPFLANPFVSLAVKYSNKLINSKLYIYY